MGWQIELTTNDVVIPATLVKELFDAQDFEGAIWDSIEDVIDEDNNLTFNPDHMEHMDYLGNQLEIINVLKAGRVKGDILFQSLEGDDAGSAWGYRFDGKGGMKLMKGEVNWSADEEN